MDVYNTIRHYEPAAMKKKVFIVISLLIFQNVVSATCRHTDIIDKTKTNTETN